MSPVSHPSNAAFVAGHVKMMPTPPRRILDVCAGNGDFGKLLRIMLPKATIDAVEIHPPYVTDEMFAPYNVVHLGDALDVLPRLRNYDLALLLGSLEHFERPDGTRLLALLAEHAAESIVITPHNPSKQGPVNGNEHERHVSKWTLEDFDGYRVRNQSDGARLRVIFGAQT